MLLNIFLIISIIIILLAIFLIKRKRKDVDKLYIDIFITVFSTFFGAFMAINLALYQNETKEKEQFIAILESERAICDEEISTTRFILNNIDDKPIATSIM